MADGAELRGAIKVAHYRFAVQLGAGKNIVKCDGAGNRGAIFIDHHCRRSHHVTSRAAGVLDLLNGMADHAGDSIFIKGTIDGRTAGEGTGEESNGIVTAFTMPGEFNTFLLDQHIDIVLIKRRAEGIGMRRLTPLLMRFRMACSAITCRRELLRSKKGITDGFCLAGKKRAVAEAIVILWAGFFAVGGICIVRGIVAGTTIIKACTHQANHAQDSRSQGGSYPSEVE